MRVANQKHKRRTKERYSFILLPLVCGLLTVMRLRYRWEVSLHDRTQCRRVLSDHFLLQSLKVLHREHHKELIFADADSFGCDFATEKFCLVDLEKRTDVGGEKLRSFEQRDSGAIHIVKEAETLKEKKWGKRLSFSLIFLSLALSKSFLFLLSSLSLFLCVSVSLCLSFSCPLPDTDSDRVPPVC